MSNIPNPQLEWHPIIEPPPERFGWFAAAVNPDNANEISTQDINRWREHFGFTMAWYNSYASDKWWEPDPHGRDQRPIGHRMTHWAKLPPVPMITDDTLRGQTPLEKGDFVKARNGVLGTIQEICGLGVWVACDDHEKFTDYGNPVGVKWDDIIEVIKTTTPTT